MFVFNNAFISSACMFKFQDWKMWHMCKNKVYPLYLLWKVWTTLTIVYRYLFSHLVSKSQIWRVVLINSSQGGWKLQLSEQCPVTEIRLTSGKRALKWKWNTLQYFQTSIQVNNCMDNLSHKRRFYVGINFDQENCIFLK